MSNFLTSYGDGAINVANITPLWFIPWRTGVVVKGTSKLLLHELSGGWSSCSNSMRASLMFPSFLSWPIWTKHSNKELLNKSFLTIVNRQNGDRVRRTVLFTCSVSTQVVAWRSDHTVWAHRTWILASYRRRFTRTVGVGVKRETHAQLQTSDSVCNR